MNYINNNFPTYLANNAGTKRKDYMKQVASPEWKKLSDKEKEKYTPSDESKEACQKSRKKGSGTSDQDKLKALVQKKASQRDNYTIWEKKVEKKVKGGVQKVTVPALKSTPGAEKRSATWCEKIADTCEREDAKIRGLEAKINKDSDKRAQLAKIFEGKPAAMRKQVLDSGKKPISPFITWTMSERERVTALIQKGGPDAEVFTTPKGGGFVSMQDLGKTPAKYDHKKFMSHAGAQWKDMSAEKQLSYESPAYNAYRVYMDNKKETDKAQKALAKKAKEAASKNKAEKTKKEKEKKQADKAKKKKVMDAAKEKAQKLIADAKNSLD